MLKLRGADHHKGEFPFTVNTNYGIAAIPLASIELKQKSSNIRFSSGSLLFAFEESREQLFRNAHGWGMDFETLENKKLLKVICLYPEVRGLEDHLITIRDSIEEFKPQRVAVDSLSALERAASAKGFREFVLNLTSYKR